MGSDADMEDYGFEYSDEEPEEQDVDIENQYYNSKGLVETEPEAALEGFAEVVRMEPEKAEWGFKALKQTVKLYYKLGKYKEMMDAYREMLTYIKSAVTRNYSEKCINNIMDFVSGSASQNFSLLQEFYETTLKALEEAKNERLWFKTNLKLCKIWFDIGEYGRMSKILKELHKSCQKEDGTDDQKKGTQLLEVYAIEIQMYTETKNNKKLKELYNKALSVKSAIPHPRIMGIIRECGGKMHMAERQWAEAATDFFEAFKNYDEAGNQRRIQCLKYLVLANMLMESEVNPFDGQEAKPSLSAFYMRSFAEKVSDIKPPLLQLLVSFWQDEAEHVKMAARSLFHCAASRAIPSPLRRDNTRDKENGVSPTGNHDAVSTEEPTNCLKDDSQIVTEGNSEDEQSEIRSWLESFEMQDWISCVGGTSQDAMTSHIIVAAALAVWYPSLVKPNLVVLAVNPLVKLVMAMNEKYSSTAAEILAEGMESTWKASIGSEIPRLIGDIFFQIECVSGSSANTPSKNPSTSVMIRDTLVGILLPSLAMADVLAFLNVIESQIWSTASDSPVHVVSLMTIVRIARGSPRNLVQYLDKVVTFILQTMDPGNLVMRRTCLQNSMVALKEIARIFPMVALNDPLTRLAVGDAIGEINNASIRVYDMQSMTKIKVLDASGPPGFPSLLGGASGMTVTTAISALSFSPDGEGVVAFSETGMMIRWWSYSSGSVWWEKLSKNLVHVQCTKLIFVPPWEGFLPNANRSSIMASVFGKDGEANPKENTNASNELDRFKQLLHNIDLSYRIEWVGQRKIKLTQHGRDLGTFQL